MSNKYIERFDKNIKTFQNQEEKVCYLLLLIGEVWYIFIPFPLQNV